jgi:succinyl-CoA:acetate CoA-transferase
MVKLLAADKIRFASATAFSLSPNAAHALKHAQVPPQDREEISNHPEPIRRLGCIAMNGLIEGDIYGNVNSTHVMGVVHPERHRRLRRFRPQRLCVDPACRPSSGRM